MSAARTPDPATTAPILVGFLAGGVAYSALPSHAGSSYVVARPLIAFLLPLAAGMTAVLLDRLWNRDVIRDRDPVEEGHYRAMTRRIVWFILAMHALILDALLLAPHSSVAGEILARLAPIVLGVTLISIGNTLPRLRPNLVFGIRTNRLLNDRSAWQRVHRMVGYLAVGLGLMMVGVGLWPARG